MEREALQLQAQEPRQKKQWASGWEMGAWEVQRTVLWEVEVSR